MNRAPEQEGAPAAFLSSGQQVQLLEIQLEIEKQRTEQEKQRTEQERQKFNQEKEKSWRFSLQVSKQCLDEARDIAFNNWDATHGAD